ncbi:hypothetical protein [Pseudoteredinibacter isoporae]|uniref:Uncharacterized protein n=1 Tax=Pseudoteredinibacter isoporae TaxID=570281 RepID=A0A7X0JQT3_9GAMM|nr:hypothetical protein [Pseudoteredinibacter isoporae]MBB6520550.1 hypothetical protein [Pseudoteredinibacter isoporae]NHO86117.1 hypothetical protein [Pseudoteredinibacter isoporae]NIB25432.1 hypothetical protein [Pseudoteredinibacter isoporae]
MWFTLALTTQAAMIGCLFFSWQAPKQNKLWFRSAALLALAASLFCWKSLAGWEFGLSYFFIAASLIAWAVILNQAPEAKPGNVKGKAEKALAINVKKIVLFILRFLFYVLIIGGITAYASIAISYDLPLGEPEQMTVATFLFPSLWASLIIYSFVSDKLWRLAIILTALASYAWVRLPL